MHRDMDVSNKRDSPEQFMGRRPEKAGNSRMALCLKSRTSGV